MHNLLLSHTTYKHPSSTEWVTFVHGAGGSAAIWFKQIKAFKTHYNVLLLDLRGHGNSKLIETSEAYTFGVVANDIIEVLNYNNISKSHFVGISLGTIIIRQIAANYPSYVLSLTMAGAIMKLNIRSQILMRLGMVSKSFIPYLLLYKFFAYIIMPRKNHRNSRLLFIKEAKKLTQQEFIKWFRLSTEVNPLLREFRNTNLQQPCLYIMGNEDAMFLPSIKKLVIAQYQNSILVIAKKCGHVVNIDQPDYFNKRVLAFIKINSTVQSGAKLTIIT